jgi:hypothetical protein
MQQGLADNGFGYLELEFLAMTQEKRPTCGSGC